uniref:Uncharacterized protein n=1 Tax=Bos indicus x Bos taurus TaxID=30522 RepID=A0A4W2EN72_BOBOX
IKTSKSKQYQSFPVAALSNCKIMLFSSARASGTNTCKITLPPELRTLTYCFAFRTSRRSLTGAESMNSAAISSILANPSALEARSLASWKSSFSARLTSITDLLPGALNNLHRAVCPISSKLHSSPFSRSVVSDSLRPHGLQHAKLSCPSPTPGACSNSRLSNR